MSDLQPSDSTTQPANNGKRKILLAFFGALALSAVIGWALYYFLSARFYESTEDAYVNGNVVQITPQVTGTIIAVRADDTQLVKAGDPLISLDPADAKVALAQAQANLAQTVRQTRTLYANTHAQQATVIQRQADLSRARNDLQRRLKLLQAGAVSQEEIAHLRDSIKSAQAALNAAQQQLVANLALTEHTSIAKHPNVLAAAAKVREVYLNAARSELPAPISGYVAKRAAQVGQRVAPGAPLMAIVSLDEVWVDANFKEVQLKKIRIGQPVELKADAYGSSVTYHGHISGFAAGTGSAFALLPAQNASGNWIKIVQRLPIRITLDKEELQKHPLRIGFSMHAKVNLRNTRNANLSTPPSPHYQTKVFAQYGAEAEKEIQRIIAENVEAKSL